MITTAEAIRPDLDALKARQRKTWASGRFARIGSLLQITGEQLAESMDVRAGARFLDVAAGNGNLTMAAARRFAQVESTDFVPSALSDGARRAKANGLAVRYRVADAEALPYADDSYDYVGSTFGVMFAPDQEQAAAEMLRVCKPGGVIGLACWTPEGFIGDLLRLVGRYNPPPAGLESPARWGTEAFLADAFGRDAASVQVIRRDCVFRFFSAKHFLEVFAEFYGPIRTALARMSLQDGRAFESDLIELLNEWSDATDGSLRVPAEYLELVITTRQ